jgi:hypothetical protein
VACHIARPTCADLATKEPLADKVTDVALYLMQIADRTGVDLMPAVGRKLVKNSKE